MRQAVPFLRITEGEVDTVLRHQVERAMLRRAQHDARHRDTEHLTILTIVLDARRDQVAVQGKSLEACRVHRALHALTRLLSDIAVGAIVMVRSPLRAISVTLLSGP